MIVLKFGGSSVAGANEVEQVLAVLSAQKKPMTVVVSALGGITDELHALGKLAANGDASYADRLKKVEERHVHMVQALIPVSKRSAILSTTKQIINKLETILEGAVAEHKKYLGVLVSGNFKGSQSLFWFLNILFSRY